MTGGYGHHTRPDSLPVHADRMNGGSNGSALAAWFAVRLATPRWSARLGGWLRRRPRVLVVWWRHSSRVPLALKSRPHARQAGKDATVWLVMSPLRLASATARGVVVAVRVWHRWRTVRDYRQAAEEAGKLADRYEDIRALILFRSKVTATVALAVVFGLLVAHVVYGPPALWTAGAVAAIVLAIVGRRKDGAPGRRPTLAGPRTLTWTMDPQVLVDAFRDAKLIGKDETLRLVERAHRQGDGWAITIDLPATRKATDVIKQREALASALAVDEIQLVTERVRGKGGHAGRVAMWVDRKSVV